MPQHIIDISNELQSLINVIAARPTYYGRPVSQSIIKQMQIEIRPNGAGIIKEPDTVYFEPTGNGIKERFPPMYVEIVKQTSPEQTAEQNRITFTECRSVAHEFVFLVMRSGYFKKIAQVTALKITERKYDANVIGWQLAVDLTPITNMKNC